MVCCVCVCARGRDVKPLLRVAARALRARAHPGYCVFINKETTVAL